MNLEGKALKEFEKWYAFHIYSETVNLFGLNEFYKYPDSMKWGVIQDWFDSVEMSVCIEGDKRNGFMFSIYNFGAAEFNAIEYDFKTRPQAREAAVKKAVEIFNGRG